MTAATAAATHIEGSAPDVGVRRPRHAAKPAKPVRSVRRGRVRLVAGGLALAMVTAVLAGALYWRSTGGHWFVVQTPSMGQAAPVGTLLLTQPATVADTRVGDLITFHSPSGQTYSHRVVGRTNTGLQTQGDINGTVDPWTVTDKTLIGKVVARWWAAGWLLKALPLVLLGLAVSWTIAAFFPRRRRSAVRQLGTTITTALTTYWLHPWVGLEKLGTSALAGASTSGHDPAVAMRVVSTGILPIKVRDAGGGRTEHLRDGQVGEVAIHHQSSKGAYNLDAGLHLTFGWWVAVVIFCLAPLAWSLLTAPRRELVPAEAAA